MRYNLISIKTFFYITTLSMLIVLYLSLNDLKTQNEIIFIKRIKGVENTMEKLLQHLDKNIEDDKSNSKPKSELKYILQWTSPKNVPFVYMGEGQKGFIDRNCTFTNCYVTSNRTYLGDYTKFDLIAFSGPEAVRMNKIFLPDRRSPHQKFAFASIESSDNYPVCSDKLNNVFNWTWTYKLESEAKWGYIVVRDANRNIIGPKKIMHWLRLAEMDPVSDELKEKLKKKTKAAAWFVSNCYSRSGREKFVRELQAALKKYNLDVDIYGKCGPLKCSRDDQDDCNKMLSANYYFYLSFENSFAEDYVTEKLLYPLQHDAIPIVFGGANYTRFMPDGIYLNARELGAEKLASKMQELILNPNLYAEYFRWKKHYSFYRRYESIDTDDYCSFCTILNNEELVKRTSIYEDFRHWWDPPGRC
ncbi:alpha-(1,3)-fucosyltransferase C-like [Maniola hyperantus]|uniref:alpha-(1,3)-fucosyltransferase C-like n=1 Tax=Aphantopus hyperantus TaxID=2795564 RepID=UPI001569AAED|nr:alpha-(1,3)-fucosyltransferase C-like [Maniola hyperantus]